MRATITVGLKPGVLDTEGKAVASALHELGFQAVTGARVAKVIELELATEDRDAAEAQVREMCERLLANPVIETYRIELH